MAEDKHTPEIDPDFDNLDMDDDIFLETDEFIEETEETESVDEKTPNIIEEKFPDISKRFEENPTTVFADPKYYSLVLTKGKDSSTRINELLQKYAGTTDVHDRGIYRQQIIPAYWEFFRDTVPEVGGSMSEPKRNMLRFGIIHPALLNSEAKDFFAKLIVENEYKQPVYYLDEWFKDVGIGNINKSSTDEVRVKSTGIAQITQQFERATGKLEAAKALLQKASSTRVSNETLLQTYVEAITEQTSFEDIPNVVYPYTDSQRQTIMSIQDILKELLKIDREETALFRDFEQARTDAYTIKERLKAEGNALKTGVDIKVILSEFESIRQMAKMMAGRQGNHFPILTSEYFRSSADNVAFRENVLTTFTWIESIDPEVFCRMYKTKKNRIVPFTILIPSYGDSGICWEPFDRHNRATSRGRIALPLYPRNLQIAILSAIGDFRWQVAKEKASFHWMDEGLTGNYYMYCTDKKLKGDLKELFIQDYIQWITKESEGIPRLSKELRGIFWRYLPFTQEIKEKLKTRSFTYQELYQRDINRSMSDGY
ncbi:MAG: hypothetical protein LBQ77_07170 [Treponema sp.]|jgi:hypothetical protein|nr:hypothetical protein [Treponema sp.]